MSTTNWQLSEEDRKTLNMAGIDPTKDGLNNQDKFLVLANARVQRKEDELAKRNRCAKCWFHANDCVCSKFPPLQFSVNVSFLIYIHYIELYNAGNDVKILLNAAEAETEMFIFGKNGDDERLREKIRGNEKNTVLLFPSDDACSVEEVKATFRSGTGEAASDKPLQIIVVDGTWRQAKNMCKHFKKNISSKVRLVKLSPTTLSVYARTQTEPDRISTIEAIGLLVQELGEDPAVCQAIISYLEINNQVRSGREDSPCQGLRKFPQFPMHSDAALQSAVGLYACAGLIPSACRAGSFTCVYL
jgi:DTW domain-containing protein YfiP